MKKIVELTFVLIVLSFYAVEGRSERSCPRDLSACASPSEYQLAHYAATHPNQTDVFAETAFGIRYPSLTASLTLNSHVLLEDTFLIEKLQSVNRELIPNRFVHAKGTGAFGYFKVTKDISKYTKADFLQPGKRTRVAVRFSTAAGEVGSADTAFDFKGLAVKFYTKEGIHDLLTLNFPIFPIRDGMLFTDLVRARRRNPQSNLYDLNAFWDFLSLRPETILFMLHHFSDIAFPKSYRAIDAFAINTFKMVNAKCERVYVKFHLLADQKREFLNSTEAIKIAGENPDYLIQDVYESIERKEEFSWTLKIQVMTYEQAKNHYQNPFDATKFWKDEEYPLITVGKLVLNENPKNFFAEVEQMAFSPSHMVPGIEPSPDIVLHSRMFAYPDSQLYRLGTNFAQIPVNSCPFQVRTYHRNGFMTVNGNGGDAPNYYPNSFNGLNSYSEKCKERSCPVCGDVVRIDTGDDDNFSLPKYYWDNSIKEDERQRIIAGMAGSISKVRPHIQQRVINELAYKVSEDFGDGLKAALQNLLKISK